MAKVLINIDVPDIEGAIAFYSAAFELGLKRRLSAEVVELAGAEAAIFLLAKPAGTRANAGNGICLLQFKARGYDEGGV